MFSRVLLLVLLVFVCLQSFTSAQNGRGPSRCCLVYQRTKIPLQAITKYAVTELQCTKPGIIFTTRKDQDVCADPRVDWVQKHVNQINERMFQSQIEPLDAA